MSLLQALIAAKLSGSGGEGGGGGGSITVDEELNANSTNPVQNRTITLLAARLLEELASKADEETTVTVSGTTPTIEPQANTIYNCGELTSLTISNPPATGAYSIKFVSGATPTYATIPPKPAMLWQTDDNNPPQGFPAANTLYEVNVKDTRVVLGEWPVPEVSA